MDQRYGLILGQGRSGTNWILDSLDASPMTFCRNEPNECVPSVMDLLPNPWRIGADGARLAQLWDRVAEETLLLMGERDHRLNHPKTFVNPLSQRLGIAQLSARPRLRKQLSRVLWSWGDGEWRMPQWVGHLDDPEIFGVFKLVQGYNWATWVLDNPLAFPSCRWCDIQRAAMRVFFVDISRPLTPKRHASERSNNCVSWCPKRSSPNAWGPSTI